MNPEPAMNPREELELRITALLLGELSEAEAADMRAVLARDAELQKLHDDLKQTIQLVREAGVADAESMTEPAGPLKLADERRKSLRAAFIIPPLKPEAAKGETGLSYRLLAVLAVLMIVGLLASMLMPALSKSKSRAQSVAVLSNLRQLEQAKQMWAEDNQKAAGAAPTLEDLKPYLGGRTGLPTVGGEKYIAGKVGEPVAVELDAKQAQRNFARLASKPPAADQNGRVVQLRPDGRLAYAARNPQSPPTGTAQETPWNASVALRGFYDDNAASANPVEAKPPTTVTALNPEPKLAPPPTEIVLPHPDSTPVWDGFASTNSLLAGADFAATGEGLSGGNRDGDLGVKRKDAATATTGDSTLAKSYDRSITSAGSLADAERERRSRAFSWEFGAQPGYAGLPASTTSPNESDSLAAAVPALGDMPAVGGLYRNGPPSASPAAGQAVSSPNKSETGTATGGGNVYAGPAVVGYVDASKPASTTGFAMALQPPASQTRRAGVVTAVADEATRSLVQDGKALSDARKHDEADAQLKKATVVEPGIQTASDYSSLREEQRDASAQSKVEQLTRPHADQSRLEQQHQLDQLVSQQKIHEARLAAEKVDVALPKSGMVEIMNRAVPPSTSEKGFLGRISDAFHGGYQATATVTAERTAPDITAFSGSRSGGVYDPYFVQTEFEAIKSEAVLTNAVHQLGLANKWGVDPTEALARLRRRIELKAKPNSTFIDISVKDGDPKEAAAIANAVAEGYLEWRLTQTREASETGIKALAQRFAENQKKIEAAQRELAALKGSGQPTNASQRIDAPLPRPPATNAPIPQPEVQTGDNPFSTFSLNVSDVSFKLAAASLERGQLPDPASVRSEEFINAFDYRDPEPAAGAPIAFAWERAQDPFAHNRDLLRFSLKTAAAGRPAGRPLNLVLLLDNSGSMERADRVQIIREALRVLATQLQPQDKLSVVTFARTPRLFADGVAGDQAGGVFEQVGGLTPQGGTNLEEAMNLAYQTALRHYLGGGINRVVLLTDGAANLGEVNPATLQQKVEGYRKQGVALDCFGIGWEDYNDDLLEVLSRNGDGRYGFLNSPAEAASEFAGQLAGALQVAASDVKVQVEFNPRRVTAYRQIGYARHQLTKEQFRDNTVDAAEIAAQEAGNALYTVAVNPAGEGPLGTVRVRYKVPGTTDYREQAWDVPYTGSALSLDQASPAMRLAATAAAFSEWLVASPFAGDVSPAALLRYLNGVPEVFGADSRPKKLEWMIRQAKAVSGQ